VAYQLGVDLGTTYTAAAVARDGRVEIASMGSQSATVPSVIFVREDDTILVGEAAARRALTEPTRVVREFKRRFGDPTPIIVAGSPYAADTLMAKLLEWVVDTVAAREGGRPERIVLTYPANWGPYKQDLLGQALRIADVGDVSTITEPEAAAISYAATERVEPGTVIAVYDLGGGTFDAAVLRKTADGFELLGRPEGIEHLGGLDFDEAVFAHVRDACAGAFDDLDPGDPGVRAAVAHVRRECTEAKEALSADTEAAIPVLLTVHTQVRITRAEFEAMIRPTLAPTVAALSRAIASTGLAPEQVDVVLLAGGSSRIPLVGQLIAEQLGRPVAVDVHPKHAVALGAARQASSGAPAATKASVPPPAPQIDLPPPPPPPPPSPPVAPPAPPEPEPAPGAPSEPPPVAARAGNGRPRRPIVIAAVAAIALVVAAVALTRDGGGGGGEDGATTSTTADAASEGVLTLADFPGGWREDDGTDLLALTQMRRGCTPAMEADDQEPTPIFLFGSGALTQVTATAWRFADADQASEGAGFLAGPNFFSCIEGSLQGIFEAEGATVGTPRREAVSSPLTRDGAEVEHVRYVLPVTGYVENNTLDVVVVRKELFMTLLLLLRTNSPVPDDIRSTLLDGIIERA
jgi:actin-like ATPase involved in cell morphogenesis